MTFRSRCCDQASADCRKHYNEPRWRPPHEQQQKSYDRHREIVSPRDPGRPHWIVECCEKQADHRGVDTAQRLLRTRSSAQIVPERQRTQRKEEAGRNIAMRQSAAQPLGCGPITAPRTRRSNAQKTLSVWAG